jgi:hypothetical protein
MRISARMEELRLGREGAQVAESGLQRDPSMHRTRAVRWPLSEIGAGLGRVRQSDQRIPSGRPDRPGRWLGLLTSSPTDYPTLRSGLANHSQVGKILVGGIDLNKARMRQVRRGADRLIPLTQRVHRLRCRRSRARTQ